MKREKIAYWVLGGVVFIIALAGLYMVNRGHVREQAQLNDTIQAAQASFPKLVGDNRGLTGQLSRANEELNQAESQLARTMTSLANAKARFPQSVQSIEYEEKLFAAAESKGLAVQVVTSTELAQEKGPTSSLSFILVTFSVNVQGNLSDIVDLVGILATDQAFSTAAIRSVSVSVPEPLTQAEKEGLTPEEISEQEMASATIALAVYGYQGG